MQLYHRTSIAEARSIVQRGFEDLEWDFGLQDARSGEETTVTGVWVTDRPLGPNEGIEGDALVEVTVELSDDELAPHELEGLFWDARLWVLPAPLLNERGSARIHAVDPRTSWWHEAQDEGGELP